MTVGAKFFQFALAGDVAMMVGPIYCLCGVARHATWGFGRAVRDELVRRYLAGPK